MKPVTGVFEQVSIVLASFVFILWNGYCSEGSAHEILGESYFFDYEVEELYTKVNTAAVKDTIKLSTTLILMTNGEKMFNHFRKL